MKRLPTQPHFFVLACVLAAATTTGLAACGKFEVDPKTKGVSTNSNPLQAEAENLVRDLVAPSPSSQLQGEAPPAETASDDTRDAALDQARRLFEEELHGSGATAPAEAPAAPATVVTAQPPAPAATAPAEAPAATVPAEPVAPAAPVSPALVAKDLNDEAKGQLLLQLVEPTMRINFVLAKQRREILTLKKILDDKKELSAEQKEKLTAFKRSYLLVPEDSVEALLSRVDTIAFSIMVAPLLLETNWSQSGSITGEALSARVQMLNTLPTDEAVRFRSARLAVKGKKLSDEARQIYLGELGYNPDAGKNDALEQLRLTQMEVERVMKASGISTMLDNRIKEITALLIKEATAK